MKALRFLVILLIILWSSIASAQWTNQPAHMGTVLDCGFETTLCGGQLYTVFGGYSVTSLVDAPLSPTVVFQNRKPAGSNSGGNQVGYAAPPGTREIYAGSYWKMNAQFQGVTAGIRTDGHNCSEPGFECNSNNKLIFMYNNIANTGYFGFTANNGNIQDKSFFYFDLNNTIFNNNHVDGGSQLLYGAGCTVLVDRWYKLELYMKSSSGGGAQNGVIKWWIDGQLCGNYTNLVWEGDLRGWEPNHTWDPASPAGTADSFHWFDHVHIALPGGTPPPQDTTDPTTPGSPSASAGNTQVTIQWVASIDPGNPSSGIRRYNVERQNACTGSFSFIGSTTSLSYTDTSLTNGTIQCYRVRAEDNAGRFSPYSTTVSATPTGGGGGGTLTLTRDPSCGHLFMVNGVCKFIWGVTDFDVLEWKQSDVDYFGSKGVQLVRILLDFQGFRNGVRFNKSIFNSNGTRDDAKVAIVQAFLDACKAKGIVVDVSILHADIDGENSAIWLTTQTARRAAVVNGINAFKHNTHVFFDVVNEHNYGAFADSHSTEMNLFMSDAIAECGTCIIFHSSSDNIGDDSVAHIFTTRSGCTPDGANISAELANGVMVLTPHNDRQQGWNLLTTCRTQNLINWLNSNGYPNIQVYFQEDAREGSGGLFDPWGDQNAVASYIQLMKDFKNAGGAAYIFHTDAGFFKENGETFVSHLRPIESSVIDQAAAALGSTGGGGGSVIRDTPLVSETCTGTNTDLGPTWRAGYTNHTNLQKVADRCRAVSTTQESFETNTTVLPDRQYISAIIPTSNGVGDREVRIALRAAAPPSNARYEARFASGSGYTYTGAITRKESNNNPIQLRSTSAFTVQPGGSIAFEADGSLLTLYYNNVAITSINDSNLTSGFCGFYMSSSASLSAFEVDNIQCGGLIDSGGTPTLPTITSLNVTSTGFTVTYSPGTAFIKLETEVRDDLIPVGDIPDGVYNTVWTTSDGYVCIKAVNSAGVVNSNSSDYQCRPPVLVGGSCSLTLTPGGCNPSIVNQFPKTGLRSLRTNYPSGNLTSGPGAGAPLYQQFLPKDEVWTRHWHREESFVAGTGLTKQFRVGPIGKNPNFLVTYFNGVKRLGVVTTAEAGNCIDGSGPFAGCNYVPSVSVPLMNASAYSCVETHFKYNSPGVANGQFEIYVDGQVVLSATNRLFRGSLSPGTNNNYADAQFELLTIEAEYGLGDRYFDNFGISTTRLGCGTSQGDTQGPNQVQGLTVTPGKRYNQLAWQIPLDVGGGTIASYDVYACQGDACTPVFLRTVGANNFVHNNLFEGSKYRYQVLARDGSGNPSQLSSIAEGTTSPLGTFGITTNAKISIDGVEKFLLCITYNDGINWHQTDIDDLQLRGFNCIRTYLDWSVSPSSNDGSHSIFNANGTLKNTQKQALHDLINYANGKKMVVNVVIYGAHTSFWITNPSNRLTGVTNAMNEYENHEYVMFDVVSNHQATSFAATDSDILTLVQQAHSICLFCIVYASAGAPLMSPADSSTDINNTSVDFKANNGYNAIGVLDYRSSNWWQATGLRVLAYKLRLSNIGRNNLPVLFVEPNRHGDVFNSTETQYITAALGARDNGAAMWNFNHSGSTNLNGQSLMGFGLNPVETDIVNNIGQALGLTGSILPPERPSGVIVN